MWSRDENLVFPTDRETTGWKSGKEKRNTEGGGRKRIRIKPIARPIWCSYTTLQGGEKKKIQSRAGGGKERGETPDRP